MTAQEVTSSAFGERVMNAWHGSALGYKIAAIGVLAALLIWGVTKVLVRIGRSGRRHLLVACTALFLVAAIVFGSWSFRLPEPVGTYFVLWHQVVRVCAAVSTTLFIISSMVLAIPVILNRIEG